MEDKNQPEVAESSPSLSTETTPPNIDQAPIPTTTVVTTVDPTTPKGKLPLILGLIVLLVALTGLSYYLGTRSSTYNIQNIVVSPTLSAQPSPSKLQNTTTRNAIPEGWSEFKDETRGFSINFPNTWVLSGPATESDNTIVYANSNESFGGVTEPVNYYVWITQETTLPQYNFTNEKIGDFLIYKTDDLPSRSGALTSYITSDGIKYISVSLSPYSTSNPYLSQETHVGIYNQIISGFRFIN